MCGRCFYPMCQHQFPQMKHPPEPAMFRLSREGRPGHGRRLHVVGRRQGRSWEEAGEACGGDSEFCGVFLSVFLPVGAFHGGRRLGHGGAAAEERNGKGETKMEAALRGRAGTCLDFGGSSPSMRAGAPRGRSCLAPLGKNKQPHRHLPSPRPLHAGCSPIVPPRQFCCANTWPCNGLEADFGWKSRLSFSEKPP